MGSRMMGPAVGIAAFLLGLGAGSAARLPTAPPDLDVDRTNQSIKVRYLARPESKQIQIKLVMQEGTSLKELESRKVTVPKDGQVSESFKIPLLQNCAYVVEVEEAGEKSRDVKNLYDLASRPNAKKVQISQLLGIPLQQIGSFLEKVTDSIQLNPEGKNIFRVDVNTKAISRLTLISDGTVTSPTVSFEGSHVAFVWNRAERQEICVLNLDATPAKPDAIQVICPGSSPIWYRGGKKLVYLREGKVYRRDLAGGAEEVLFPGCLDLFTTLLGWTRDGRLLAAVNLSSSFDQPWALDIQANRCTLLDYDRAYLLLPRISLDGKSIVHARWPGAGEKTSLFLKPLGEAESRITNSAAAPGAQFDDDSPSWFPDGKSIVFVSDRP
jgi:WD40-like Beta Propeller Repeat